MMKLYLLDNWCAIIREAYSVRFALASAVSALIVAWQTRSLEAIIPAFFALMAIVARIIAQPSINAAKVIGEIK